MRKREYKVQSPISKALLLALLGLSSLPMQAEVAYSIPLKGEEHQIGNMLEWSTANEVNSQMFIIEKSSDGIDYQNIGVVDAAGESESERGYRYLDINSTEEKNFYRLKQVDFDGTASYSQTIIIKRVIPNEFMIVAMTNTTTNKLFNLSLDAMTEGSLSYSLRSIKGDLIFEGQQELVFGLNDIEFNLEDETAGVYRIELKKGEEEESLVIQKVDDEMMKKENVASKRQSNGG
ncbi:MAG: hypothetical protein AAFP19_23730 [Bacteroidota bacterium]